ncbi:hypothetical protein ACFPK9_07925 [Rubritalea spongiae]|uniref:hypothetical protein n=1 Tax=Rubritalea spongiae TaxID=430797 RepID=UPI0036117D13
MIIDDVVPFLIKVFLVADAVVEEIALPLDITLFGDVAFPRFHERGHSGTFVPTEADEHVEVVWHDHDEEGVASLLFAVEEPSVYELGGGGVFS